MLTPAPGGVGQTPALKPLTGCLTLKSWCRRGSDRTSHFVTFVRRYSSLPLASPMEPAMLAAEATPWLLPRCYRVATAPDHAVTLRFQAGRALDAQETRLRLFCDGRPSSAD